MGASKKAVMRYRLIDAALTSKSNPYPSLNQVIDYVNKNLAGLFDDVVVSRRTVQKDLHDMRYSEEVGLFAPIEYNQSKRGYYYDDEHFSISKLPLKEEERQVIELVANMLSRYESIPMFHSFKHIAQKIFDALDIHSGVESDEYLEDAIQFDTYPEAKGNEWLAPVSDAIKQYKKLSIQYKPFGSDTVHKRLLHPYILKEFKGRWYLIGISETANEVRTYALDRIEGLEMLDSSFPFDAQFDRKKYFEHSFGIYNLKDQEPQLIKLQFNRIQGLYVLNRPIHPTQKLESEDEQFITISLKLYVSEDLIMEILSYGDRVKVVEPQGLRDVVLDRVKAAMSKYV